MHCPQKRQNYGRMGVAECVHHGSQTDDRRHHQPLTNFRLQVSSSQKEEGKHQDGVTEQKFFEAGANSQKVFNSSPQLQFPNRNPEPWFVACPHQPISDERKKEKQTNRLPPSDRSFKERLEVTAGNLVSLTEIQFGSVHPLRCHHRDDD